MSNKIIPYESLMAIGGSLNNLLNEDITKPTIGWSLLMFHIVDSEIYINSQEVQGNFISNVSNKDMIRILREQADKLEKGDIESLNPGGSHER